MRDNYINLETIKYGKHEYTILKNNDKILYFELVNGKYELPISSFELFDNEGKSLTSVNQHFFMNQLISRINIACKKGIFVSNEEVIDYLRRIKSESENDIQLRKLFKGVLMPEIDEENFEKNKKELLRYLDRFKFDTFVNYNNVSIFNGSLEKNDVNKNQVVDEPIVSTSVQDFQQSVQPTVEQNVVQEVSIEPDVAVVQPAVESISSFQSAPVQSGIPVSRVQQSIPVQNVQTPLQQSTSTVQELAESSINQDDIFKEPPVETAKPRTLSVEELFGNSNLDQTVKIPVMQNKPEVVKNNEPSDPEDVIMENKSYAATMNTPFELLNDVNKSRNSRVSIRNSQFSYLDEVRNRIENNIKENASNSLDVKPQVQSFVENINEQLNIEPEVIKDRSELEDINDLDDSFNDVEEEKIDKKIIVFFVILSLLLMVLTYVIYNYVF